MKKAVTAFLAAILALAIGVFVGCAGGNSDGRIAGNYKEVSDGQLRAIVSSVNAQNLAGDTSAEDWKFGTDLSASVSCSVKSGEQKVSFTGKISYKLSLEKGENGALSIKGSGSLDLEGKGLGNAGMLPSENGGKGDIRLKIKFYNDGEYVYASLTLTVDGKDETPENSAVKIPLDYVLGEIDGIVPSLPDSDAGQFPADDSLYEELAALKAAGLKVEVDNENGIKLKISADTAVLKKLAADLIGGIGGSSPAPAPIEDTGADVFSVSVSPKSLGLEEMIGIREDSKFEIYAAIDKNGVLSKMASNAKLGLIVYSDPASKEAAGEISVSETMSVRFGKVTVSLDGLNKDNYAEIGGTGGMPFLAERTAA